MPLIQLRVRIGSRRLSLAIVSPPLTAQRSATGCAVCSMHSMQLGTAHLWHSLQTAAPPAVRSPGAAPAHVVSTGFQTVPPKGAARTCSRSRFADSAAPGAQLGVPAQTSPRLPCNRNVASTGFSGRLLQSAARKPCARAAALLNGLAGPSWRPRGRAGITAGTPLRGRR